MWSLQYPAEQQRMTINMRVWSASLIQNPPMMKTSHWHSVGTRWVLWLRSREPEKVVGPGVKIILTSILFRALVREDKNNMRYLAWAPHLTDLEQTPLPEILSLLLLGTSAFLASPHLHRSVSSLSTIYIKLILNFQQQKTYFNSYFWDLYLTYHNWYKKQLLFLPLPSTYALNSLTVLPATRISSFPSAIHAEAYSSLVFDLLFYYYWSCIHIHSLLPLMC